MKVVASNPIKSVVAFYDSHEMAEDAIIRLQQSGFDMKQFSIIAVDLYTSEKVLGYYTVVDSMKKGARTGGFYAGFWGLLFGFSTDSIPFIGPVLMQGWIGAIIAGLGLGLIGAIISAIGVGLYRVLVPKHKKVKYKTMVNAGKYMLLAQADAQMLERCMAILDLRIPKEKHNAKDWRALKQV